METGTDSPPPYSRKIDENSRIGLWQLRCEGHTVSRSRGRHPAVEMRELRACLQGGERKRKYEIKTPSVGFSFEFYALFTPTRMPNVSRRFSDTVTWQVYIEDTERVLSNVLLPECKEQLTKGDPNMTQTEGRNRFTAVNDRESIFRMRRFSAKVKDRENETTRPATQKDDKRPSATGNKMDTNLISRICVQNVGMSEEETVVEW